MIYARFSPRPRAGESRSCETQEAQCREYAATRGWDVKVVHFDKAISGDEYPRPGLMAAISALGPGDVLLVYNRDRIARKMLIAEMVQDHVDQRGAAIQAVDGDVVDGRDTSPEATLTRQLLAAFAQYKKAEMAERTRQAMRALQRSGRRMGRYAPYGWRIDPDDPKALIEVGVEQDAIRRAIQLMSAGMNDHAIARLLDKEHPQAARSARWSARTIGRLRKRI